MANETPVPNGGQYYEAPDVLARYLDHRHSPTNSPNIVMEEPAFLAEMGDISGQRVLDLGCGDASFAPLVIERGATAYVGVDGSAAMIAAARRHTEHPRTVALHQAIESDFPSGAPFDLVASRMALHYIEDLDSVLARTRAALVPGGRMIFTVVHPVITSNINADNGPRTNHTVDRYFERGARQRPWFGSVVNWEHRTIEDYLASTRRAGLDFVSLRECEPDATRLADAPDELERRRRVPLMLLVHAQRPLSPSPSLTHRD